MNESSYYHYQRLVLSVWTFTILICMYACMCVKLLQSCLILCDYAGLLWSARLLYPWDSPGKNNGVGCPPPRDLSDPGIKPPSLKSPALAGRFFTTSSTWEVPYACILWIYNKLPWVSLMFSETESHALELHPVWEIGSSCVAGAGGVSEKQTQDPWNTSCPKDFRSVFSVAAGG